MKKWRPAHRHRSHPMKIDFVTTGLDIGGAELMLVHLVQELRRRGHQVRVASLSTRGAMSSRLENSDIETSALAITPVTIVSGVVRLSRWLQRGGANLVQTWMYHANLLGTIANGLSGNGPLVWGVRQSNLHPRLSKKSTRLVAALGGKFSRYADSIVCCAESVRRVHQGLGYDARRMVVIPNGVDVEKFRPMDGAKRRLRAALGVDDDAKLIGLIGRYDPQKDIGTFLDAVSILAEKIGRVEVVLCGSGMVGENSELTRLLASRCGGCSANLLGMRTDVHEVISGLDLLVSSASYGEGFPNVVAEAMACQVPVVGTDVGETTSIVGEFGWTVEPERPARLADAMLRVFGMNADERQARCEMGRLHVERNYSLDRMCSSYERLYLDTLGEGA